MAKKCGPSPQQKIKAIFTNVRSHFPYHAFYQLQALLRRKVVFHCQWLRKYRISSRQPIIELPTARDYPELIYLVQPKNNQLRFYPSLEQ